MKCLKLIYLVFFCCGCRIKETDSAESRVYVIQKDENSRKQERQLWEKALKGTTLNKGYSFSNFGKTFVILDNVSTVARDVLPEDESLFPLKKFQMPGKRFEIIGKTKSLLFARTLGFNLSKTDDLSPKVVQDTLTGRLSVASGIVTILWKTEVQENLWDLGLRTLAKVAELKISYVTAQSWSEVLSALEILQKRKDVESATLNLIQRQMQTH